MSSTGPARPGWREGDQAAMAGGCHSGLWVQRGDAHAPHSSQALLELGSAGAGRDRSLGCLTWTLCLESPAPDEVTSCWEKNKQVIYFWAR